MPDADGCDSRRASALDSGRLLRSQQAGISVTAALATLSPRQSRAIFRETVMLLTLIKTALVAAFLTVPVSFSRAGEGDGIVRVRSAVAMDEAITRIKKDIAAKGIRFFDEIDQAKLAADAGIKLRPSTLLVFGNPPLGTQFITANPNAGLDWPVRLLLTEDENGQLWAVYTDFNWIAHRHGITTRDAQFKMATSVVSSILSTIETK
jgi:uncharacterized protein (DUF302 family)